MYLIVLKLIRESSSKPNYGDIFEGFNFFGQTFVFVVIWLLILLIGNFVLSIFPKGIGYMLKFVFFVLVMLFSQFGILLITDKKMDFKEAFITGIQIGRVHFPFLFAFTLVWIILSSLGSILSLIGVILTMPISFCMIAYAYLDLFKANNR